MKKIIPILMTTLLLCATYQVNAKVITVSNDASVPAQYAVIQSAVDAAVVGDTIYVNGSEQPYTETVYIRKKLVLIGAGYNPNKQNRYKTYVNAIYFERTTVIAQDPSGSYISGFELGALNIYRTNTSAGLVGSITITRCKPNAITIADANGGVSGLLIKHNIINTLNFYKGDWTIGSGANITVTNNIIKDVQYAVNSNTTLFSNNIIEKINAWAIKNATFANNIFLGDYINAFSGQQSIGSVFVTPSVAVGNNTFNNNISYTNVLFGDQYKSNYTPNNDFVNSFYRDVTYNGVNSGGLNQIGVDPLFENVDFTKPVDYYLNDFRLSANSPGKNAGTNGSDIGIYGGLTPWPDGGEPGSGFQLSPVPPIPQVLYMNVINAVIAEGSELQVEVKASKGY